MPITIDGTADPIAQPELPKADPCVTIIFGASGDLTRRKLVPALCRLWKAGSLAENYAVIGVDARDFTDEQFRGHLTEGARDSDDARGIPADAWNTFVARASYIKGDLQTDAPFQAIAARLSDIAKSGASANCLFYFATPPTLAPALIRGLGAAGLASEENGWARIVVEKPFGRDLASAQKLNTDIAEVFKEHQVYRIDHYLGKETVQNILVFRFGNSMFEPVWNRNYVEYVEITAAEPLGTGGRAGYYEQAGALRDMVANHLLQLLTLTAMEAPVEFDADSVREQKVQVLRSIHPMTPDEAADRSVRGQYGAGAIDGEEVPGYRQEAGVARFSNTETFVALDLRISNWRWADVPFYVRSGKRLSRHLTEIVVHLKRTPHALFSRAPEDRIKPNTIVIRIQPFEGIQVTFGAKRPGAEMHTATVHMDFSYQSAFRVRSPEAYETLLLDVMRGDATLFTRRDEVEAQWKLITPIEQAWATLDVPAFPNYAAGSHGPKAADQLPARNGHAWASL